MKATVFQLAVFTCPTKESGTEKQNITLFFISDMPSSHCCFSSLRAGGSLARIYRGLLVFLCVALSALDRANTNLLIQYVVVGDSFGTFSARSQTTIDPKVTKII